MGFMSTASKEIIVLASVAIGSMAAGFLIVYMLLGSGQQGSLPDPFAGEGDPGAIGSRELDTPGTKATKSDEPEKKAARQAPEPEDDSAAVKGPASTAKAVEPEPEPATVASRPTGQIGLDVGEPFIWRCWPEGSDTHLEKDACDDLPGVKDLVTEHLGIVESCVLEQLGKDASGKLSLALKLDFRDGSINAWLGNSTTVENMADVSACLRSGFENVAAPEVAHENSRYIVFFTVQVG